MSDLISREKAYEVLTDYYHQRTPIQHQALREALDMVPSAELQPTCNKLATSCNQLATDYIRREDAIEALRRAEALTKAFGYHNVIDTIRELPTADIDLSDYSDRLWRKAYDQGRADAEPRWIPVSERLPEEEDYHDFWEFPDGAVLWCKDTGEIGIGWYYKLSNNWSDLWDNAVRNIVAWMPLPEPWKGGAE